MLKKVVAFFILVLCSLQQFSQTTVSGRVLDAITREPVPFVNILFKGTKNGGSSDFDGNFTITTDSQSDSIIATYIGYKRTTVKIKTGLKQELNIVMAQNSLELAAVEVRPGENPAHRIMRKVIEHKPNNDREELDAYQYELYNKVEFDLNNISKEFKSRTVLKPIKFVFDKIDSTNKDEKPFLPLFMAEYLSDYYYTKSPKFKKEVIKASKVSGVQMGSISQFMGDMYLNLNLYDNSLILFSKTFASPVSDSWNYFYKYYLIDSVIIGSHRCYHIQFKPKRKQDYCFAGNMWISDTTFAVKRIEMSMANDANINFVKGFSMVQDYEQVDSIWMLQKDKLTIDFSLQDNSMGIYGRKTSSYKNFKFNAPREADFYSQASNLMVDEDALKKDDIFWTTARHDSLSKNEKGIYQMVDTIKSLPIYKTWVDVVTLIVSGYKTYEYFDIGPYFNIISFNEVEGTRLRLGGRTSRKFSKWYQLSGYVAYGFDDNQFKYSLGYKTFLSKKPRILLDVNYKSDYEVLGQTQTAFTQDNILASLAGGRTFKNMTNIERSEVSLDYEWLPGLNTKIAFVNKIYSRLLGETYLLREPGWTKNRDNQYVNTSEVTFTARYAKNEKFIGDGFKPLSVGTRSPIFMLDYTVGFSGVFGSDYNYNKVAFSVDDRIYMNPFGYLNYTIEVSQIFGKLPYPLLLIHPGNETPIFDGTAFNTMNFFEFVSDRYASLSLVHHFNGFFFNRVPLFRKLKFRELFIAKAVVGDISPASIDATVLPVGLYNLKSGPFVEVGAGIENILKIFRIDALWRLTYLDHPGISPFAIRGSLQIVF